MLPFAIVVGQNLFGAFYSLLSRRLAVKLPHAQVQVGAVLFTITYLITLPFAVWHGGVHVAALIDWWPYIVLGGLTTALNVVVLLFIYRYMDAAMGSLLTTINVVVSVLSAMYVLGERMGVQEITGAMLVLLAVVYALSVHVNRRERRNWTMGILFTLVGACLSAIGSVIEKSLLGEMTPTSYLVWGWGAQWLISVAFALLFGAQHFASVLTKRNTTLLVGAGVTRTGMGVLFVGSLVVLKSLCLALVLASLRPLFVTFLGAWLLRERKFLRRKVVASLIAAAGIAIMFL